MSIELDRTCDFCDQPAIADCQGVGGRPWAYCCETHRRIWSIGGDQDVGEHPLETQLVPVSPKAPVLDTIMTMGAVLETKAQGAPIGAQISSETLSIIDGWIEEDKRVEEARNVDR